MAIKVAMIGASRERTRDWRIYADERAETEQSRDFEASSWGRMTLEERLAELYGTEGARLMLRYPDTIPGEQVKRIVHGL